MFSKVKEERCNIIVKLIGIEVLLKEEKKAKKEVKQSWLLSVVFKRGE
jgi:hypothetical protein